VDAPVLRCQGLRKAFRDLVAVDDVSFRIGPGETYGLLGPNGAGKTTSISIAAGLLHPDAGEVEVAGRRMTPKATDAKAAVGLVPQELAVYPELTARENLRFFARLYGMDRRHGDQRVDEVLEVIGLTDRADDRASEYSGGMKRRLNIGIGLLHEPTLLILDEPTVGVDPQSRNAILEAVEELSATGMAVLYTTHYMEEAERLCTRIGIIDEGRIVAEGTRRELVSLVDDQDHVRLDVAGDAAAVAEACQALEAVSSADLDDGGVSCSVTDAAAVLAELLSAASGTGATITGVEVHGADLETVFLHLTGKALRD